MYVIYVTVVFTCPKFLEVFYAVVLGESHTESLWPSESETPVMLRPAGKILIITKEKAVTTTQLLESQVLNNEFGCADCILLCW